MAEQGGTRPASSGARAQGKASPHIGHRLPCAATHRKGLKGLLSWHDRPFRKTHNLVELGGQCAELEPGLEDLLRRAATLTEYAWKFRYPGEPEEPPVREADEAMALGRQVYKAVLSLLPEEVRP